MDFVLVDGRTNILIDAKGVEMGYLGMVTHQPEIISDRTKTSVTKGIEQGYETAARLEGMGEIEGIALGKCSNYLLLVTYKDLYVGRNGQDFHDAIDAHRVDRIIAAHQGRELIPLEHIFFISVDDLDVLVGRIEQAKGGLAEQLGAIVEANRKPDQSRFVFRQHMYGADLVDPTPSFLRAEFDAFISHLRDRVGPSPSR